MRILHTADWHIGHRFYNHDRTSEFAHFFEWLLEVVCQQQPDAFLLSGDIFHQLYPSQDVEKLFWNFFTRLTTQHPSLQVIISTGNHDSASWLEASMPIFHRLGMHICTSLPLDKNGRVQMDTLCVPVSAVSAPDEQVVVLPVPYYEGNGADKSVSEGENIQQHILDLVQSAKEAFPSLPIVLMAHVFAMESKFQNTDGSEYVVKSGFNAVDMQRIASRVAYAALGHIHCAQAVGGISNVWYAGEALPLSFAEKNYNFGVNIVDIAGSSALVVSHLSYHPVRTLVTIPVNKRSALLQEVLQELSQFEKCKKDDTPALYPFVEIKLDASLSQQQGVVDQILQEARKRRVCICRIERVTNKTEQSVDALSVSEELQQLSPALLVRNLYASAFGEPMTDDMAKLIADVKRTCEGKV